MSKHMSSESSDESTLGVILNTFIDSTRDNIHSAMSQNLLANIMSYFVGVIVATFLSSWPWWVSLFLVFPAGALSVAMFTAETTVFYQVFDRDRRHHKGKHRP